MSVAEARRVTGRHPLLPGPGVAAELVLGPAEAARVQAALPAAFAEIWPALGLGSGVPVVRAHAAGLSVALSAPVDLLDPAVDVLEAVLGHLVAPAGGAPSAADFAAAVEAAARPGLRAALAAAAAAGLPAFVDDDGLTVGAGRGARTVAVEGLSADGGWPPGAHAVPIVFVTGTNGKTTSARMVAAIAAAAGHTPGLTSSDGVVIGGQWVERGDWTGPGAARQVLRAAAVDFAVLETARGGLLRRGLVVDGADAALVTNISDDHLGEWGLDTLADMAWAKLTVANGVRRGGVVVVGEASAPLREALPALRAARPDLAIWAFAEGAAGAESGAAGWTAPGPDGAEWLWVRPPGAAAEALLPVGAVPATVGGLVRTMVQNALGAALLAHAAGLSWAAVRAGLAGFVPDVARSRGRLNRFRLPVGATAVVDFAHNPAGIDGLEPLCAAARPGRVTVLAGQAGDRPDALLDAYAAAVARLRPDRVILKELPHYRRGRAEGEVRARLRAGLRAAGVPESALVDVADEADAVAAAISGAAAGDLLLLLVHEDVDAALAALGAAGAVPAG
jgi:UDP-N-acetylmuramyl tripeptide synthase